MRPIRRSSHSAPNVGWPSWIDETGMGYEFTNVDSEVIRAIGMMFNTQSGQSVQVTPAQLATVTFSTVATAGSTTVVARSASTAARVPHGYTLAPGLSYDVETTAIVDGSVQMCVLTHWDSPTFDRLRVLQIDRPGNGQPKYVDRTILEGALAPNASTKRLCAELPAVGPIAIALRERGK